MDDRIAPNGVVPHPPRYSVRPVDTTDHGVFDTFTQTFEPGRYTSYALALRAVLRYNTSYVRFGKFGQEGRRDSAAW